MLPELRISIDCDAGFRRPAQYTIAMLALIAGRRVRFVSQSPDLHYGPTARMDARWLPASAAAAALPKRAPTDFAATDLEYFGQPLLGLFPVSVESELPTDIVAAAFYFLSLHEEWTTERRDQFGRFMAADSLLGKRGETDRPVISEYARAFARAAGLMPPEEAPADRYAGHRAAAVMTHDIDYLSKFTPGLLFREVVKNFLFNRRKVSIGERFTRLGEYLSYFSRARDPYMVSIRRMLAEEQRRKIRGSWLFKSGGSDKRDVTYSLRSSRAAEILALLNEAGQDIGLHPSFNAHTDPVMLSNEAQKLRKAAGRVLLSIRQHYLRFDYPVTWRQQAGEGFIADSTLGFAEREGFRNGSCHPFLPWDLDAQSPLPVWEVPLTVMDGTLAHYRGLDTGEAGKRIAELLTIVSEHQGVAVLLFHNTSYDAHDFPGWGEVFEYACGKISDGRFLTAPLHEIPMAWMQSAGYGSTFELLEVINSVPAE